MSPKSKIQFEKARSAIGTEDLDEENNDLYTEQPVKIAQKQMAVACLQEPIQPSLGKSQTFVT